MRDRQTDRAQVVIVRHTHTKPTPRCCSRSAIFSHQVPFTRRINYLHTHKRLCVYPTSRWRADSSSQRNYLKKKKREHLLTDCLGRFRWQAIRPMVVFEFFYCETFQTNKILVKLSLCMAYISASRMRLALVLPENSDERSV